MSYKEPLSTGDIHEMLVAFAQRLKEKSISLVDLRVGLRKMGYNATEIEEIIRSWTK